MTPNRTLIAVASYLIVLLAMTGCKDGHTPPGEIPYDKERAKVHLISLKRADRYKDDYGTTKLEVRKRCDTSFFDKNFDLPMAEMFNRDAIALLLNQKGADGIRVYFGKDSLGQVRLVLLPVDKSGKDIRQVLLDYRSVTQKAAAQTDGFDDEGGGQAVELGQRCPTICN